jgi:hypothetical protein
MTATYYRGLQSWPEREAISRITCPRMAFAGTDDVIVSEGRTFRLGPLLAERQQESQNLGWSVHLIDGYEHDDGP